jgi:hypothetical protein
MSFLTGVNQPEFEKLRRVSFLTGVNQPEFEKLRRVSFLTGVNQPARGCSVDRAAPGQTPKRYNSRRSYGPEIFQKYSLSDLTRISGEAVMSCSSIVSFARLKWGKGI